MLGFKIGDEDLELTPGTQLEIERNNPYLQFNDEIAGEFSMPFEFSATPKNTRLINYASLLQQRVDPSGIEAKCYDGGIQDSIGKIKIEKPQVDLNRSQNGKVSAFYLTGISYFFQDIKNKKLKDLDLGGDRQFANDNLNRNGSGFWGHIHDVVDAGTGYGTTGYDYAFYPVKNLSYGYGVFQVQVDTQCMNYMKLVGGLPTFWPTGTDGKDSNVIVPMIYLSYLLKKIEALVGWRFEGDILNDPDFKKITLINSNAIDWAFFNPYRILMVLPVVLPRPIASFNLLNHIPDMTIGEFLAALKNRFGLSYDIEKREKVVRFKNLNTVAASGYKDMTAQAGPAVTKTILQQKKIYSLKTTEGRGAISLTGYVDMGAVNLGIELPAPTEARYLHVYLIRTENNYFVCERNEATDVWQWNLLAYNTGDYVPANATEEITTAALVPGLERVDDTYLDLCPRWDELGWWPGRTDEISPPLVMTFYYGLRVNKFNKICPFASPHIYDSTGLQVGNWSLSFLGRKTDNTEVGLYEVNWKPFIDKLNTLETIDLLLYLTRNEFMQLKFSDVISVVGVRMYMAKIKYQLPYNGQVQLECSRI